MVSARGRSSRLFSMVSARGRSSPRRSRRDAVPASLGCGRARWRLAGRAVGDGVLAQSAHLSRGPGRVGRRGLRALRPRDPGRGAGSGDAEGDGRAGLSEPRRGGQDQAVSDGRSAGGSCHAGECDLEEELAGWRRRRRQVGVSRTCTLGRGELRSGTRVGGGRSPPGTWRGARAAGAAAG